MVELDSIEACAKFNSWKFSLVVCTFMFMPNIGLMDELL
jgi:hypothetical protein